MDEIAAGIRAAAPAATVAPPSAVWRTQSVLLLALLASFDIGRNTARFLDGAHTCTRLLLSIRGRSWPGESPTATRRFARQRFI